MRSPCHTVNLAGHLFNTGEGIVFLQCPQYGFSDYTLRGFPSTGTHQHTILLFEGPTRVNFLCPLHFYGNLIFLLVLETPSQNKTAWILNASNSNGLFFITRHLKFVSILGIHSILGNDLLVILSILETTNMPLQLFLLSPHTFFRWQLIFWPRKKPGLNRMFGGILV